MIARYRDGRLAKTPGPGAFDAGALREAIVERLDRYDITGALEEIWQAVRALNRHVESSAPWQLAKDEAKAGELDAVLYDLADGIVAVAVAVAPYLPETAPRILAALGQSGDLSLDRIAAHSRRRCRGDRAVAAALPARGRGGASCVIDTHAHLDALDDPDEAVERARAAGVTRILTVGTTVEGCRVALELADRHAEVYAILGIHPHSAAEADDAAVAEVRGLLDHPKAVAVGEIGLDHFRDYAPHDAQARLFERFLAIAAETGKPVVIHTRAADDDTAAALAGFDGRVVLHCFSSPALLPVALERGYYVSFAGNVTFPKASDLRIAAQQVPADRILAETDTPYLAPQPVRGRQNEPAYVVAHARRRSPRRGTWSRPSSRRRSTRTPPPPSALRTERQRRARSSASTSSSTRTSSASSAASPSSTPPTSSSRSARAWASSPATSPSASRSSTPSRSTARSSRTCRACRTSASSSATRSASTSPTSTRRPASSSRTCRTTSPRRSSSRASTACPRSSGGA